jgi:predicted CopG family antitoxin
MMDRHTITINQRAFEKLKGKGLFGESYSELIIRLIKTAETKELAKNE